MKVRGFTLIEVILYIGLFAILMSGAIVSAYQLLKGGDRNQVAVSVQEEGTFIDRKINWALSNATDLSASSSSTLVITRPDLINQSPIVISAATGTLMMSRGQGAPVALNADTMVVSDVVFQVQPPQNGRPAALNTSFQILGIPFVFSKYLRQ